MSQVTPAILAGGPCHGRVVHVQPVSSAIVIPAAAPIPVFVELPERRWWHRLLRRPVPLPPGPAPFRNLTYRRTGEQAPGGEAIYRYHPEGTPDVT